MIVDHIASNNFLQLPCRSSQSKGREPEWSNPQIKCGKVHECPEIKFLYKINFTLYPKENHQQLLKHIINISIIMRNELFVG